MYEKSTRASVQKVRYYSLLDQLCAAYYIRISILILLDVLLSNSAMVCMFYNLTTMHSNDTLVDTLFQLISYFFHVNQGV